MWSWATTKEHDLCFHVLFSITVTITAPQFRLQKWSHMTIMLSNKSFAYSMCHGFVAHSFTKRDIREGGSRKGGEKHRSWCHKSTANGFIWNESHASKVMQPESYASKECLKPVRPVAPQKRTSVEVLIRKNEWILFPIKQATIRWSWKRLWFENAKNKLPVK